MEQTGGGTGNPAPELRQDDISQRIAAESIFLVAGVGPPLDVTRAKIRLDFCARKSEQGAEDRHSFEARDRSHSNQPGDVGPARQSEKQCFHRVVGVVAEHYDSFRNFGDKLPPDGEPCGSGAFLQTGPGGETERDFAEGNVTVFSEVAGGGGVLPGFFAAQAVFKMDGGNGAAEPVAGMETGEQCDGAVSAAGKADEKMMAGKRSKNFIAFFKLHL